MADSVDYKRFGALSVILVDGDPSSAQFSRNILSSLGIYQIRIVHDYEQFLAATAQEPADLVVYDTHNKTQADLAFIHKLRNEPSDVATTPILALSSNITKEDVYNLVNCGATDLVAKPSDTKTVFGRIQNMVDSPRSFICTKDFKGPDRRRKQQPGRDDENRTARAPKTVTREEFLRGDFDGPVMIQPDFALKVKTNHITLGNIMRPAVEDEFVFWSVSDLSTIEAGQMAMADGAPAAPHIERICSSCLSIEARSEAYGYELGREVAGMLRTFCQVHFQDGEKEHLVVLEKHIQTLSLIYNGRMRGDGGAQGQALKNDLGLLAKKYSV